MLETITYENIILAFILYWITVVILNKRGVLERYNISTIGPILMVRTVKGQKMLDFIALPKQFWRLFADIGLPLMIIGMLVMFILILVTDYAMISSILTKTMPEPGKYQAARNIFLIPGVNEFIPLVWGTIALLVTLVVHEFAHAILCKVEGVRVKSMGVLLAPIPIGAFAEPDEEQLFDSLPDNDKNQNKNKDKNQGTDRYGDRKILEKGNLNIILDTSSLSDVPRDSITTSASSTPSIPKKVATRKERVRILTAGVMANFMTALIAFLLLFGPALGAIEPLSDVAVMGIINDSPASIAGIPTGMILTYVDDKPIMKAHDFFDAVSSAGPNNTIIISGQLEKINVSYELTTREPDNEMRGVRIASLVNGSTADEIGILPGTIIYSIDDVRLNDTDEFLEFMNSTHPEQSITISGMYNKSPVNYTAILGSARKMGLDTDKGYVGVFAEDSTTIDSITGIRVGEYPASTILHLFKSIPASLKTPYGWIMLSALPIIGFDGNGFSGISEQMSNFLIPVGWAADLGPGIFWIVNSLLWIGWVNFYVGLFNCLPAVPLDGGHVFRDLLHSIFSKISPNNGAAHIANYIVGMLAILILGSFLFMIFGPAVVHGFS